MILPDINLLLYVHSRNAPDHKKAKEWWDKSLTEGVPVALPWVVICGFVRLVTRRAVLDPPLTVAEALAFVRRWLERPSVTPVDPGPRHFEVFSGLLEKVGVAGKLTTDAHIAAIAIERECELHSNDSDFLRFPGLRVKNPLKTWR